MKQEKTISVLGYGSRNEHRAYTDCYDFHISAQAKQYRNIHEINKVDMKIPITCEVAKVCPPIARYRNRTFHMVATMH